MLIELAVLVAAMCGLMVALNPRSPLLRRARLKVVGGTARRGALGPTALRRAGLTPILGGPARMPRLAPAVAFGGPRLTAADEIAGLAIPAASHTRATSRSVDAPAPRRSPEPVAARATGRGPSRRTARPQAVATR
jgi:hypothetical protein